MKLFYRVSLTLCLLLGLTLPAAAQPTNPFNPQEIPVEMQAWWFPAYGHVHAAIRLPFAQEVSGTLTLPVRIVMHDNPGKLHRFSITDDNAKVIFTQNMGDQTCTASVCAWGLTATLNTAQLKNGCQELRVKAYVDTPDKKQMINSSGIPIMVKNGTAKGKDFNNACQTKQLIGRGWYTDFDYTNGILIGVPIAPVKGIFTFQARAQQPSAHLFVAYDKSHAIPAVAGWQADVDAPGIVLFDKDGDFQKPMSFSIDTTKLANGWHNLQAKSTKPTGAVSKCTGCPPDKNFPIGIAKIWFYVQN